MRGIEPFCIQQHSTWYMDDTLLSIYWTSSNIYWSINVELGVCLKIKLVTILEGKLQNKFPVYQNKIIKQQWGVSEISVTLSLNASFQKISIPPTEAPPATLPCWMLYLWYPYPLKYRWFSHLVWYWEECCEARQKWPRVGDWSTRPW